MNKRITLGRKIFNVFNILFLSLVSLTCLLPFLNLLAISLSDGAAASAGMVGFVPVGFNFSTYQFVLGNDSFITAFGISILRVVLGVSLNLAVVIMTAYPLSKSSKMFKGRNIFAWFFVVSMLFVPTTIPLFVTVQSLGLMDTIFALILPGALPVFNMIVMLNFFRNLPKEIEEAALIDGANHVTILLKIFIPLSKPSIATITLFCVIFHWNTWLDGILYMNSPDNYPLQSYLQTIVVNPEQLFRLMGNDPSIAEMLSVISNTTAKSAQLFLGMIPVLIVYPFLQKYFTSGLVLGSVKG